MIRFKNSAKMLYFWAIFLLIVFLFVLKSVMVNAGEEMLDEKYRNKWIEIAPNTGIYIGPQGIGVPGALKSFLLKGRLKKRVIEIATGEALKKLVEKFVSKGAAQFFDLVSTGITVEELVSDWLESTIEDIERTSILETISKITGYEFKDQGVPGGMRVLRIPGWEKMTLKQRCETAGLLLQMYRQAVKDYNENYGYIDQGLYSGKLQQYKHMIELWRNRPEVSRLKMKIHEYAKSVPSYWTYENRPQAKTEVEIMANMVRGANKALIVGTGDIADLMYDKMVERLGIQNVKRIDSYKDNKQLQIEAKRFGADVILGVKKRRYYPGGPGGGRGGGGGQFGNFGGGVSSSASFKHPMWVSDIGGVMLQGVAQVSNTQDTITQLGNGTFSIIFQNGDSEIDIPKLRKFVTALWAVYFSKEGPGVSIDPLPSGKKHLVRYIGKVINTDLARVMREADYTMKKWAVGIEKPDIPGFKSVDELSAIHGIRHIGVSRRFWFVPENFKFKLVDNALLFESGKMRLKTEYVFLNKGSKAEPADEAFAKFFTEHYDEIAKKYPIYQELFEYAKLVSLARYLKEKGVPMLWFLLANKDMVITENSPGTVNALAKKSEYYEYIKIEGGVNLALKPSAASYVIDQEVAQAINKAITLYGMDLVEGSSVLPSESIAIETTDEDFTFIPAKTLTFSPRTVTGDKYQTDLALRYGKEPGLELVRYYDPRYKGINTFGKGWHLMIPYQVEAYGNRKIRFLNAIIPEKMVVKNLLTGQKVLLTFSKDRYSIAGYVPDNIETSNLIGLFLLSDGSFRLVDKLGNEFQFDQEGNLTEMIFSNEYCTKFEYEYEEAKREKFGILPYKIEPAGDEFENFLNVRLPKKIRFVDMINRRKELFIFNPTNRYGIVGYTPVDKENSRYRILGILTDGSFVLADKQECEVFFDCTGRFEKIRCKVIKGFSQGDYRVEFDYEFKGIKPRIKKAQVMRKRQTTILYTVRYEYGKDGRLCKIITPSGQEIGLKYEGDKVIMAKRNGCE